MHICNEYYHETALKSLLIQYDNYSVKASRSPDVNFLIDLHIQFVSNVYINSHGLCRIH